jgi:probable rRNA maturation factor
MTLAILNRQRTKKINTRLLKEIVQAVFAELKIESVESVELGISLVGAREMTLLNETFLKHEGSTDIITFDYQEPGTGSRKPELKLHGELFICVDEAILQAKRFRSTWQAEIVRYVVHGILHLLGHDDLKPALRRRMKREENRLVRRLSRKISFAQLSRTAKIGA